MEDLSTVFLYFSASQYSAAIQHNAKENNPYCRKSFKQSFKTKINLNLYFHLSSRYLKRFYEEFMRAKNLTVLQKT